MRWHSAHCRRGRGLRLHERSRSVDAVQNRRSLRRSGMVASRKLPRAQICWIDHCDVSHLRLHRRLWTSSSVPDDRVWSVTSPIACAPAPRAAKRLRPTGRLHDRLTPNRRGVVASLPWALMQTPTSYAAQSDELGVRWVGLEIARSVWACARDGVVHGGRRVGATALGGGERWGRQGGRRGRTRAVRKALMRATEPRPGRAASVAIRSPDCVPYS